MRFVRLCAGIKHHRASAGSFRMSLRMAPRTSRASGLGHILIAKDAVEVTPPACPTFGFGGTYSLTTGRLLGPELTVLSVTVPNKPAKDRPPMIEPKAISYYMGDGDVPVIKVS